jgi:hypothetical protein
VHAIPLTLTPPMPTGGREPSRRHVIPFPKFDGSPRGGCGRVQRPITSKSLSRKLGLDEDEIDGARAMPSSWLVGFRIGT